MDEKKYKKHDSLSKHITGETQKARDAGSKGSQETGGVQEMQEVEGDGKLPTKGNEAQIDFDALREKLEAFKKAVVKRFSFIKSIGILPVKAFPMFEEEEIPPEFQEEIKKTKPLHLIMIIPEEEYKNFPKIKPEIVKLAKDSGERLWAHIKTEVDIWQYGLDSKFSFIDAISASVPLHDNGFLGALRVANIHKSLVLGRFDRYIATYIIGGSLVRGIADKTSDVDVAIIIDDTDVKRMSRIELLERLRGIIYDYIREASALAGVKNLLEPQIWLLTDFWQGIKDASPVYYTFIRYGIPLFDRGIFLAWKRLLEMGKIEPSPEAIEQRMKESDRMHDFVKRRLIDTMIDIYYSIVTPTQALMMLAGHAPPAPKTIVGEVKEVLVDKEKVMNESELKILEKAVKYFKDYEHGKLKELTGKEIDEFRKESEEYNKKMKKIKERLELKIQEHVVEQVNGDIVKLLKNIFGDMSQVELIEKLDKELVKKGKLPPKMTNIAREIVKLKQKLRNKKLTQTEMQSLSRDANELIKVLIEYTQRKELVSAEKGVVQVVFGNKKGEIVLTDSGVFFVSEDGIKKIKGKELVNSEKKELEDAIVNTRKDKLQVKISSDVLDVLKKEIGEFELLI